MHKCTVLQPVQYASKRRRSVIFSRPILSACSASLWLGCLTWYQREFLGEMAPVARASEQLCYLVPCRGASGSGRDASHAPGAQKRSRLFVHRYKRLRTKSSVAGLIEIRRPQYRTVWGLYGGRTEPTPVEVKSATDYTSAAKYSRYFTNSLASVKSLNCTQSTLMKCLPCRPIYHHQVNINRANVLLLQ